MPWCEGCSRFLNPNTLNADGTCPECGRKVAEPEEVSAAIESGPTKAPWHFKLLVAVTVIYVGFRIIQMISWVIT
ncbi:MAG TPA: hypothetical protein VGJ86_12845 [Acidimicrobiales bacterium]|jgi:hypothetical protein